MAVSMQPPATTSWTFDNQVETLQPSPTGGVTSGWKVTFVTGDGHTGSVFVPDAQYSPDVVKRLIDAKVATMAQVARLSSGM